jgi:crotonobetainyl-CoA:carnitine CoA-transferase CaiB-like acyl-CoA transferase
VLLTFSREWDTLAELLSSRGMAGDLISPAWRDVDFRRRHVDKIQEILASWTNVQDREEVLRLGQDMRFPWAAVNSITEVMDNEQLRERGYFVNAEHPSKTGVFKVPRPVAGFADAPGYEWKPPPRAARKKR